MISLGAQHAAGNRPRSERATVPITKSAARSGSRMRLPGRFGDRGGACLRRTRPGAAYPEWARRASLMDGEGTQLHSMEVVVTAPSLRQTRQQQTQAGQLCWHGSGGSTGDVRQPRHGDAAGASGWGDWRRSGYTYNGHHQGYPQSAGSNEPGPMAERPKHGL